MGLGLVAFGLILLLTFQSATAEWQVLQQNILAIAFGVAANSPNNLYLTGGESSGAGKILQSSDGGNTFNDLAHDPQLAYLSVDIALDGAGVAGSLGFYNQVAPGSYSNDGRTWKAAGLNNIFSAAQSSAALDNSTFFLVGLFWPGISAGYLNGVLSSVDGGQTFVYSNWQQPETSQARYGAFVNQDTWIIAGGAWPTEVKDQLQLRSNWISERLSYQYVKGEKSVQVLLRDQPPMSPKQRKAGYEGVIVRTTDGGNTWTRVFEDYGRFYFNGIDCVDRFRCWAVAEGDSGAWIFTTSDGGATWSENSFHTGISLIQIDFSDADHGWAVGGLITTNSFNAVFLQTSDGGRSWSSSNTINNAYPNDVTAVSPTLAYSTAFLRSGLSSLLVYNS